MLYIFKWLNVKFMGERLTVLVVTRSTKQIPERVKVSTKKRTADIPIAMTMALICSRK